MAAECFSHTHIDFSESLAPRSMHRQQHPTVCTQLPNSNKLIICFRLQPFSLERAENPNLIQMTFKARLLSLNIRGNFFFSSLPLLVPAPPAFSLADVKSVSCSEDLLRAQYVSVLSAGDLCVSLSLSSSAVSHSAVKRAIVSMLRRRG